MGRSDFHTQDLPENFRQKVYTQVFEMTVRQSQLILTEPECRTLEKRADFPQIFSWHYSEKLENLTDINFIVHLGNRVGEDGVEGSAKTEELYPHAEGEVLNLGIDGVSLELHKGPLGEKAVLLEADNRNGRHCKKRFGEVP